jgi:hypothetical protein
VKVKKRQRFNQFPSYFGLEKKKKKKKKKIESLSHSGDGAGVH